MTCMRGRGRDRMVVGFTTTYVISAYHQWRCDFESRSWWCVRDTTLCNKSCQWLATDRCFSPVSSTNKTDCHDIAELLLNVTVKHQSSTQPICNMNHITVWIKLRYNINIKHNNPCIGKCTIIPKTSNTINLQTVHLVPVYFSGPGIAFMVYPEALATLPLPQIWSVMFFLMLFMIGLNTMVGCIYFVIEIHSFIVIQLWLKLRSSSLGHRRPKLILAIPFRHFSILTSNYIFNYFKYIGIKDAWWRFLQKRVVWIEFDIYVLIERCNDG